MQTINIKLTGETPCPSYAKPGDAGFDLTLNLDTTVTVEPDTTFKVGCGLALEIPEGYFGMVVPRSSLSKRNLLLANTMGIIDSGYRGEVIAVIRNVGTTPEVINPGDRLFQMVLVPFTQVAFQPVAELSETARGEAGFGSTGTTKAA